MPNASYTKRSWLFKERFLPSEVADCEAEIRIERTMKNPTRIKNEKVLIYQVVKITVKMVKITGQRDPRKEFCLEILCSFKYLVFGYLSTERIVRSSTK